MKAIKDLEAILEELKLEEGRLLKLEKERLLKLIDEQKEKNKIIRQRLGLVEVPQQPEVTNEYDHKFEGLSENTKKQYTLMLKKLEKIYNDDINDYENVMKALDSYSISSKKSTLAVLYKVTSNEKYKDEMYKINEQLDKNQEEKEDFSIDIDNIIKKYNEMELNSMKLLFMLAIFYPNVRVSDYHSIKIKSIHKKKDNYYSNGVVVFNNVCKVNNKEVITIELSEEHKQLFEKISNDSDSEFLFNQVIKAKSFSKSLSTFTNKYFGITGGFSTFRKMTYQREFNNEELDTVKKFVNVNMKQNHSPNTAIKYYTKK